VSTQLQLTNILCNKSLPSSSPSSLPSDISRGRTPSCDRFSELLVNSL
jgi:hypothetical protein